MENKKTTVAASRFSEFYNKKELLDKLGLDVKNTIELEELIFLSYIKWGIECLSHIKGDYSFYILDSTKNIIFAAVSPTTISKALYFTENKGDFFVDFDLPSLRKKIDRPLNINETKLADFLILNFVSGEQSFYQNIKKLKKGQLLLFKNKQINIQTFWNPLEFSQRASQYQSKENICEEFKSLLFGSVKRAMGNTEEPIATHLSGGLDSSSVTCVAAEILAQQSKRLISFGVVPSVSYKRPPSKPRWSFDDSAAMESVARKYKNINFNKIADFSFTPFSYAEFLAKNSDGPVLSVGNMIWIAETIKQCQALGVNKLLTGQMGNFTISWKGQQPKSTIFNKFLWRMLAISNCLKSPAETIKVFLEQRVKNVLEQPDWHDFSLFNYRWLESKSISYGDAQQSKDERIRFLLNDTQLDDAVVQYEALSRYYGVSILDPTFDQDILEFCLSLPPMAFCSGKRKVNQRLLVRRSMKGVLPEVIRKGTDRGAQDVLWFLQLNKDYKKWCALVDEMSTHAFVKEIIDVPKMKYLLYKWPSIDICSMTRKQIVGVELQYKHMLMRSLHVINWLKYTLG